METTKLNLFNIAKDEEKANFQINLKKLCRMIAKHNPTFERVEVRKLINEIMSWDKLDHVIFQCYFIQNMRVKEIVIEQKISVYRVNKSIKEGILKLAFNKEII